MSLIATVAITAPLRHICQRRGWQLDDRQHTWKGLPWFSFRWHVGNAAKGTLVVNVYDGRFYGSTRKGIRFTHATTTLEGKPWFVFLRRLIAECRPAK